MANIGILSFSNGEATPKIDARVDVEKHAASCRHLENMVPQIYGDATRRPGTKYLMASYNKRVTRMIPFIYSALIAYDLEFGDLYIRVLYNGAVITTIDSPYVVADLFQLQYRQVGDIMWIVHPNYAQRKLTRYSPEGFSLDVIDIKKAPFLIRNDLIDPYNLDTSTLACSVVNAGESGTLVSNVDLFQPSHVGAFFLLVQPRATLEITQEGAGTSSTLKVIGTAHFRTSGTWAGTVNLQRNQNFAGWEDFRTYTGLTAGARNDSLAFTERESNVYYRIYAESGMSADFGATLSIDNNENKGVIQIDSVASPLSAGITVIDDLVTTDATKKWAEGAWSAVKGYPSAITFFQDRCVYAGTVMLQAPVEEETLTYTAISTIDEFKAIDTDATSRAGSYELVCDLDLSSEDNWTPLCDNGTPFTGIFNGKNHLISNMYINRPAETFQGLFGDVDGATIKNLKLTGNITAQKCGGFMYNAVDVTLENLVATLTVSSATDSTLQHVGGIAATIGATSTVTKCNATITFLAHEGGTYMGGLVGNGNGTTFTDCFCTGSISIHPDSLNEDNYVYIGGFAGSFATSVFTRCYSTVAVNLNARNNRGGFLGDGTNTFNDNFWDTEVSTFDVGVDNDNVAGVTAQTTAEMKQEATFDNFDFDLVWDITEDVVYPFRRLFYNLSGGQRAGGQTVWCGATGDYDNFTEGVMDADSFSLRLATTDEIRWVESLKALLVGTAGSEWKIGTNELNTPITPTNFTVEEQSNYGSRNIQPVKINEQILFVDFVGRKVRELTYSDVVQKYVAPDLTALAEHITLSGIVCIAHQRNPDSILWAVLEDGSLISMTYEREQNVIGWAPHPIDGTVNSVCVIPSKDEDEIALSVTRDETVLYGGAIVTYGGAVVEYGITYIEKMQPRDFGTELEDAFFVDAGITATNSPASTTISGLDHLISQTVQVLGDGVVYTPTDVVDVNGEITIETAVSKAQAGLAFIPKLEPMKPVVETRMGMSAASIATVPEMGVSLLNSAGVKYGASDDDLFDIDLDDVRWVNLSEIDDLFTGTVVVSIDGGFSLEQPLIISSSSPLPLTVRSLIPRVEQTGR